MICSQPATYFHALLTLFFISFYPLPAYSSLFSSTQTTITQDIAWIYSNSSTLAHTDNNIIPILYSTNIKPAVNLSQPNETGLKGVLYQQDLIDCSSSRNNSNSTNMLLLNSNGDTSNIPVIPRSLPRVALIHQMKKNGCNIIDLILKAQTEGAVGAIVYGLSDVETNAVFIPTGTAVAITVYFVDMRTGEDLLSKIVTYEKIQPTRIDEVVTARPYVRVLLLPASLGTINAWEITLLIVSILLVTSFLASVIMHWHLWRKRKRQEYLVEQGLIPIPVEMLPMGKHIFEESKLEEYFPSENLDDEKLLNLNNSSNEPLLCVVCLENLTIGSKIRTLPCKHIYHCHCIDPWLTTKCAECPLCKYDCNLVAKSDGEGTVSALTAGNTSNATATENAATTESSSNSLWAKILLFLK